MDGILDLLLHFFKKKKKNTIRTGVQIHQKTNSPEESTPWQNENLLYISEQMGSPVIAWSQLDGSFHYFPEQGKMQFPQERFRPHSTSWMT